MATALPSRAQVVIIGAGIVGCSLADHLRDLGVRDVIVLEMGHKLPLTGGSTSHAPGLVFQNNVSEMMCRLAQDTVCQLRDLEVNNEPCFYEVGGIEVATTDERLEELYRRHTSATTWGMDAELLSPREVGAYLPLLETTTILGGLYTPQDGIAKAVRACEAFTRSAKHRGVRFFTETQVTGVDVRGSRVRGVRTSRGDVEAEIVVSCAGMWGPLLSEMAGFTLPLVPMEHQLAWTNTVPELRGESREVNSPMLRHRGGAMYVRQRGDHLGIGTYNHAVKPVAAGNIKSWSDCTGREMPSTHQFTWDDFDPSWKEGARLLPALDGVDVEEGINGLFSFTPDGGPLLGETMVKGFWSAQAVWITHSAGVARAVAQQIVSGKSDIDISGGNINRFRGSQLDPEYIMEHSSEAFRTVYANDYETLRP